MLVFVFVFLLVFVIVLIFCWSLSFSFCWSLSFSFYWSCLCLCVGLMHLHKYEFTMIVRARAATVATIPQRTGHEILSSYLIFVIFLHRQNFLIIFLALALGREVIFVSEIYRDRDTPAFYKPHHLDYYHHHQTDLVKAALPGLRGCRTTISSLTINFHVKIV